MVEKKRNYPTDEPVSKLQREVHESQGHLVNGLISGNKENVRQAYKSLHRLLGPEAAEVAISVALSKSELSEDPQNSPW